MVSNSKNILLARLPLWLVIKFQMRVQLMKIRFSSYCKATACKSLTVNEWLWTKDLSSSYLVLHRELSLVMSLPRIMVRTRVAFGSLCHHQRMTPGTIFRTSISRWSMEKRVHAWPWKALEKMHIWLWLLKTKTAIKMHKSQFGKSSNHPNDNTLKYYVDACSQELL